LGNQKTDGISERGSYRRGISEGAPLAKGVFERWNLAKKSRLGVAESA